MPVYSLVEMEGVEPPISGCRPDVFPLALHPHIWGGVGDSNSCKGGHSPSPKTLGQPRHDFLRNETLHDNCRRARHTWIFLLEVLLHKRTDERLG